LLLLILFLAALQPVKAERGVPSGPPHVWLKLRDAIPEHVCVGQKLTIGYLFKYELLARTAREAVP